MTADVMTQLRMSIKEDREVIRAKQEIARALAELSDDESRRRVLRATLAYYGWAVPNDR